MATATQDAAQFHAERRGILGGSDIARILGISPFGNAMDVFVEKTDPEVGPRQETEAMHFGQVLEQVIAGEFARRTGFKVQRRRKLYRHPSIPYLGGHIDRLIVGQPDGPEILECKATGSWNRNDWDDGAPLHYVAQVQHYLDVTGAVQGYIAVLIGGNDFRIVRVARDDTFIDHMHAAAEAFWLCVETGTPPTIDGSAATERALKLLYPRSNGAVVDLPGEALEWIGMRRVAKREEKKAQDAIREAENHLKALLGEAEVGTVGGYTVSWKSATRTGFDQKRLKADHPDLADQYMTETSYRTLRVKGD